MNSVSKRESDMWERLFQKYYAGELTRKERQTLTDLLRDRDEAAEAFVDYAEMTVLMTEVAWENRQARVRSKQRRTRIRFSMAIAASLTFFMGLGWWTLQTKHTVDAPSTGTVLAGTPKHLQGGSLLPLSVGSPVIPGDRLAGPGEFLTTAGTRISLSENARLDWNWNPEERRLVLRSGRVRIHASTQPEGTPLSVEGSSADVVVKGTRFELEERDQGTRVRVEEGRVVFRRHRDGKERGVGAGEEADSRHPDLLGLSAFPEWTLYSAFRERSPGTASGKTVGGVQVNALGRRLEFRGQNPDGAWEAGVAVLKADVDPMRGGVVSVGLRFDHAEKSSYLALRLLPKPKGGEGFDLLATPQMDIFLSERDLVLRRNNHGTVLAKQAVTAKEGVRMRLEVREGAAAVFVDDGLLWQGDLELPESQVYQWVLDAGQKNGETPLRAAAQHFYWDPL